MAIKRYEASIRSGRKVPIITLAVGGVKLWSGSIHQPPKHLRHVITMMGNETSASVAYSYGYHLSSSSCAVILTVRANGDPIFIGRAEHLPKRLDHLKKVVGEFVAEIRKNLRATNKH